MFSDQEIAYLKSQRLARIATVSKASQPDVAPIGFEFDGEHFYIGGLNITKTMKYKNVLINPRVALVIDDLETVDPWTPRGIKIHGTATIVDYAGRFGPRPYIRVLPHVHWSWGIEEPPFKEGKPVMKKTHWRVPSEPEL